MAIKEIKEYGQPHLIEFHYFTLDDVEHGENLMYTWREGALKSRRYYWRGKDHGCFFFCGMDHFDRGFCMHGERVPDFPFLPKKPEKLSHSPKKSRYESLEI